MTIPANKRQLVNGKCCSRKAHLFKSKRLYHCHSCFYDYDLNGRGIGYFGSGQNKEDYEEAGRAFAKAHGFA